MAAAVGTTQAIENTPPDLEDDHKGLYQLDPCLVAILKNSKAALHPEIWDFVEGWDYYSNLELTLYILLGKETGHVESNVSTLELHEISLLTFLVEQRNIPLLKIYMDKMVYDRYFSEALRTACELNFDDTIETLLHHRDWISTIVCEDLIINVDKAEKHCTKAIFHDQPKVVDQILEQVIHKIKSNYFTNKPIVCNMLRRLGSMCDALQKQDSKKIISHHYHILNRYESSSEVPTASKSDQVKTLFTLLFNGYSSTKDKIVFFFNDNGVTNLSAMINNEENIVHKADSTIIFSNVDVLKTVLDFGWDIDSVDNEGRTFFCCLLQMQSTSPYPVYRETLELAIFHNPNLSRHKSVISYGMKADLTLYETTLAAIEFEAARGPRATCDTKELYKLFGGSVGNHVGNLGYVMDGKLHGNFGHDAENSALNFMVPFLIECGFHESTEDWAALESFTEGSLHPEELEYIKQYLATPRPLKQQCRNGLRRHYTGRQIHRLVDLVTVPQQIKDYILLRPLLKYLSSNYY